MDMRELTLRVPEAMMAAVERLAQERGTTATQIVQGSLAVELKRASRGKRLKGGAPDQHVSALRSHLAGAFGRSQDWDALRRALDRQGYELRPVGAGLALFLRETGLRLCRVAELGHPYQSLCQRFGGPFPAREAAPDRAGVTLPPAPRQDAKIISLFH